MVDWILDNLPTILPTLGIASLAGIATRYAWNRFTRRHERMDIERRAELIDNIKQLSSIRKELKTSSDEDNIVFYAYYNATMTNELLKLSKELYAKKYKKINHYALQSLIIIFAIVGSFLSISYYETTENILIRILILFAGALAVTYLIIFVITNNDEKKLVSQIISSALINAKSDEETRKIVMDALTGKEFTKPVSSRFWDKVFNQLEPNEHYKKYIDNKS